MTIIDDLIHLIHIPIEKIDWNTFHLEPPVAIHSFTPLTNRGNRVCTMVGLLRSFGEAEAASDMKVRN